MNAIATLKALSGHHRIGGGLVRGTGTDAITVSDPATEQPNGEIIEATPAEVSMAIDIANRAQRGWRTINHHRRAELLHEISRRMIADRPLVAEMLTREMGKTYKESADEVSWSASAVDYYAEAARHENGRVLGPAVDGQMHFTTKDPVGVVVIILPFNYPLCLLCWQAAAAIASGNAVIINAMVPLANMFQYVNTLRSFSQGRANYTMQFDHYEQVPTAEAEKVKAKYSA